FNLFLSIFFSTFALHLSSSQFHPADSLVRTASLLLLPRKPISCGILDMLITSKGNFRSHKKKKRCKRGGAPRPELFVPVSLR
ncbi:unnamed protein product, partial [Brassica oleracea var. botrytis]